MREAPSGPLAIGLWVKGQDATLREVGRFEEALQNLVFEGVRRGAPEAVGSFLGHGGFLSGRRQDWFLGLIIGGSACNVFRAVVVRDPDGSHATSCSLP